MQQGFGQSIVTTLLLLLLCFLLTLPSPLHLKLGIQKHLWAQKIRTTVEKMKITNHPAGE
jgi:hypothetical protein